MNNSDVIQKDSKLIRSIYNELVKVFSHDQAIAILTAITIYDQCKTTDTEDAE